jgi:hypothetical protein
MIAGAAVAQVIGCIFEAAGGSERERMADVLTRVHSRSTRGNTGAMCHLSAGDFYGKAHGVARLRSRFEDWPNCEDLE